ncbi:MAG: hypothetical protein ABSC21_10505 [Terriglobia bacterium]
MRKCDLFVLPSIQEGSALATHEALGSGCVLLVSEAAGAICEHMRTGLVHLVGEVATLTKHITMLHKDRALLERLRAASLRDAPGLTWTVAGTLLLRAYQQVLAPARKATPQTLETAKHNNTLAPAMMTEGDMRG